MNRDEPVALSLGAILGDSSAENMAWKRSINEISRQVQNLRDGVSSPLRLNVVYHVDGALVPNEFEGVRTGHFDKKTAHLLVQVAVSLEPVEDRRRVLLDLLNQAVAQAEAYAASSGITDGGLPEIRKLVERLSTQ